MNKFQGDVILEIAALQTRESGSVVYMRLPWSSPFAQFGTHNCWEKNVTFPHRFLPSSPSGFSTDRDRPVEYVCRMA